jgi:ketosteroid isomerase-like protein
MVQGGFPMERQTNEERNAEVVRRLWAASSRGGTEAALELLHEDATWHLHIAPDRVLTTAQLGEMLMRLERGRRVTAAHLSRLQAKGDRVFAAGSFRWSADDGSMFDFHGYWVYELLDGRFVSGTSFGSRADALRAFGEARTASSPAD